MNKPSKIEIDDNDILHYWGSQYDVVKSKILII